MTKRVVVGVFVLLCVLFVGDGWATIRSVGKVHTLEALSIEVVVEQPDNVVRLIHAKPDGTVYVLDFSAEEARRLAEAMGHLPGLLPAPRPARIVISYTWPEFVRRNHHVSGLTELRLGEDRTQAAPTFWLDVSFASAPAPKFSEGQWTRLADLLVLGAKSL